MEQLLLGLAIVGLIALLPLMLLLNAVIILGGFQYYRIVETKTGKYMIEHGHPLVGFTPISSSGYFYLDTKLFDSISDAEAALAHMRKTEEEKAKEQQLRSDSVTKKKIVKVIK